MCVDFNDLVCVVSDAQEWKIEIQLGWPRSNSWLLLPEGVYVWASATSSYGWALE